MKFYLIPLFFFVISSVSAVTISNTTLSSSNGYSVYSNYSTENSVTITSTSININQPTAESLFTALSNSFLNITNLISPYNDINYSNLGSLIIDTANANVNILIGEPLKIFNYIVPSGGAGGGGTSYVPINLNSMEIKNDAWYTNQYNSIYAYTYSPNGTLIDPQTVTFSGNPTQEKISTGTYKATYYIKDESQINITIIAKDYTKTITENRLIYIDEPTTTNKVKNTITGFGTKAIELGNDPTARTIMFIIITTLSAVTIALVVSRKKRRKKQIKGQYLTIISSVVAILLIYYFRLDQLAEFISDPTIRFIAIFGFVILMSVVIFILILKKEKFK